MIKYNKYLEEIGIEENHYLFGNSDPRTQDKEEFGFSSAEFWNLDHTFDILIYSRLCYFREYCCNYSCPRLVDPRTMEQNFR